MAEVIISQTILEQLRCSVCKGFLSCPPIRVSSDGSSICGRCPVDEAQPTYRHLHFEAIINKISFPCTFKNDGCQELLPFGHTAEHEENCPHRSVRCPFLPVCQHMWDGPILKLPEHFISEHSKFVLKSNEFNVEMGWNNEGVVMMVVNSVPFFVTYQYNINAGIILYDVRFASANVLRASYKITVTNGVDRDYSFSLKGDVCLPLDNHISISQSSKYLFIKDFLKNLGDPERVAVALKITTDKMESDKNTELDPRVDYEVLESVRCCKCRGYLVPPIFDCEKGTVCFGCSKRVSGSVPSENEELKEYISKLRYPCRWHGCDLVDTGKTLYKHEKNCKFRVYNCLYCNEILKRETASDHLKTHGCKEVFDMVTYKMSLSQSPYFCQKFFRLKNNEIIYILCNTKRYSDTSNHHHAISLDCSDSSVALEGKIYFQHRHCKIKSKVFDISKSIDIRVGHLPDCYKESDELTVTLMI